MTVILLIFQPRSCNLHYTYYLKLFTEYFVCVITCILHVNCGQALSANAEGFDHVTVLAFSKHIELCAVYVLLVSEITFIEVRIPS